MANTSGYVQAALAGADANYLNRDQLGSSIRNLGGVLGERRVRKEDAAERQGIRDTEDKRYGIEAKRQKARDQVGDEFATIQMLLDYQKMDQDARQFATGQQTTLDLAANRQAFDKGENQADRDLRIALSKDPPEDDPFSDSRLLEIYTAVLGTVGAEFPDYAKAENYDKALISFGSALTMVLPEDDPDRLTIMKHFEDAFKPENEEVDDTLPIDKDPRRVDLSFSDDAADGEVVSTAVTDLGSGDNANYAANQEYRDTINAQQRINETEQQEGGPAYKSVRAASIDTDFEIKDSEYAQRTLADINALIMLLPSGVSTEDMTEIEDKVENIRKKKIGQDINQATDNELWKLKRLLASLVPEE